MERLTEIGEDSLTFFDHLATGCHGLQAISCQGPFWHGAVCRMPWAGRSVGTGATVATAHALWTKAAALLSEEGGQNGQRVHCSSLADHLFPVSVAPPLNSMVLGSNCGCFHKTYGPMVWYWRSECPLPQVSLEHPPCQWHDRCNWHYRFLCQQLTTVSDRLHSFPDHFGGWRIKQYISGSQVHLIAVRRILTVLTCLNPGRLEAKAGFDDIVKEQLGHIGTLFLLGHATQSRWEKTMRYWHILTILMWMLREWTEASHPPWNVEHVEHVEHRTWSLLILRSQWWMGSPAVHLSMARFQRPVKLRFAPPSLDNFVDDGEVLTWIEGRRKSADSLPDTSVAPERGCSFNFKPQIRFLHVKLEQKIADVYHT